MSQHNALSPINKSLPLGGAMAVHACLDIIHTLGIDPTSIRSLITFGQPRVGNGAFQAFLSQSLPSGTHYRLTHHKDPVPHLPLMAMGFQHEIQEVFYKADPSSYVLCNQVNKKALVCVRPFNRGRLHMRFSRTDLTLSSPPSLCLHTDRWWRPPVCKSIPNGSRYLRSSHLPGFPLHRKLPTMCHEITTTKKPRGDGGPEEGSCSRGGEGEGDEEQQFVENRLMDLCRVYVYTLYIGICLMLRKGRLDKMSFYLSN